MDSESSGPVEAAVTNELDTFAVRKQIMANMTKICGSSWIDGMTEENRFHNDEAAINQDITDMFSNQLKELREVLATDHLQDIGKAHPWVLERYWSDVQFSRECPSENRIGRTETMFFFQTFRYLSNI